MKSKSFLLLFFIIFSSLSSSANDPIRLRLERGFVSNELPFIRLDIRKENAVTFDFPISAIDRTMILTEEIFAENNGTLSFVAEEKNQQCDKDLCELNLRIIPTSTLSTHDWSLAQLHAASFIKRENYRGLEVEVWEDYLFFANLIWNDQKTLEANTFRFDITKARVVFERCIDQLNEREVPLNECY